jgi:hypothetical protein
MKERRDKKQKLDLSRFSASADRCWLQMLDQVKALEWKRKM